MVLSFGGKGGVGWCCRVGGGRNEVVLSFGGRNKVVLPFGGNEVVLSFEGGRNEVGLSFGGRRDE